MISAEEDRRAIVAYILSLDPDQIRAFVAGVLCGRSATSNAELARMVRNFAPGKVQDGP